MQERREKSRKNKAKMDSPIDFAHVSFDTLGHLAGELFELRHDAGKLLDGSLRLMPQK